MTGEEDLGYLRWLEGPEEARRLGALVLRAQTLNEVLRLSPDDPEVRAEIVRLAGAASGLTDRCGWTTAGAVVGDLVRMLAVTRRGPAPCGPIGRTLEALETLIHQRVTGTIS
jgi:hypothetical protein